MSSSGFDVVAFLRKELSRLKRIHSSLRKVQVSEACTDKAASKQVYLIQNELAGLQSTLQDLAEVSGLEWEDADDIIRRAVESEEGIEYWA